MEFKSVRENFLAKRVLNRARFEAIDRGDLILPGFLLPCRIKILMVVDGYPESFLNITFGELYFSLSAVLDTLNNNPEAWVKFDITKAHRQTDPLGEADIEGFRFTQTGFDINDYDQVWLFGARADENDADRLTDEELAVLARWMDEKQGGVFATGDHADLGAAMCARIPRVKSMRRWTETQGAPEPTGPDRHDTLLKGHDGFYTFNDESDDIPMPIDVTMFPVRSWSPFVVKTAPHPILCGTKGIIDVLPDHPHEGEVIVPTTLSDTFSFPGYTGKPEYPDMVSSPGTKAKPVVVAWARVQNDHTEITDLNKGAANSKKFGAVGAYDGHAAGVGRVVVDSTWHHWFDVNLTGRPTAPGADQVDPVDPNDPKAKGFLATPEGMKAYAKIKNYFRNVAIWLAAPLKQKCMFLRALTWVVQRYPLVELLHPRQPVWELGGYALDALGRHAGQCTARRWLVEVIDVKWRERLTEPVPEPCLSCPPIDALEQILIGSVVSEMLEITYSSRKKGKALGEQDFARAMRTGLENGTGQFAKMLSSSLNSTSTFLENIETSRAFAEELSFAGEVPEKTKVKKEAGKTTAKKPRKKK